MKWFKRCPERKTDKEVLYLKPPKFKLNDPPKHVTPDIIEGEQKQ